MKKFYILLITLPVLLLTILYFSIWGFIAAVGLMIILLIYRFYAVRLKASEVRNNELEQQNEQLQKHLDYSILKEQKTSKEAEQVRHLKQQLLGVLGHEIRTPMNGVMGMTLLLGGTSLTKEQQEYVNTIRGCGESLLTTVNDILVNDILDFSKLQQEGDKLEYKEFNLRDCIEEVVDMFGDKAGKAGLDLIYYVDENVSEQIIGDSNRLRQALMNLVENAIKFTPHGEVFIGVHAVNDEKGNYPQLNFEVRDTGIGIAAEQLEKLFTGIPGKEFPKENKTETSGLGLVICRKLAELMGGTIAVKSQPGQGSTFNFTIPVVPSLKTIHHHAQYDDMAKLEGKKILLADDNTSCCNALKKQMESWKMVITCASSGKQALDILAGHTIFDAVFADMNMPEMNGLQLARLIKEKYNSLPVILMNPAGDEKYKQEPGIFFSILVKPIKQRLLRDTLLDTFANAGSDNQNNADKLSGDFAAQHPLRILIAEDNLINQKIAVKILAKLGYQPAMANNGKEVLEMAGQENYDIILMDVQMPVMDGLEATRMIRTCLEIQPVIIAMTANVMMGDRDDCIQAGMDDYMSKPVELPELLKQLTKWSQVIRDKRKARL
jgi:signal transduction histidine kinase/DNA-binding response OmpR family regulator